jgi:hypothetical protein
VPANWSGEDAGHRFVAEDLEALLGLVVMHDTRGRKWQASDEEIEQFLAEIGVP